MFMEMKPWKCDKCKKEKGFTEQYIAIHPTIKFPIEQSQRKVLTICEDCEDELYKWIEGSTL